MSKKSICGIIATAAVLGTGLNLLPNTASKAYACTGVFGSIDPTCPGRILGRPQGNGGQSCLAVMTSRDYKFTIVNASRNRITYNINNQSFQLDPGYQSSYSYPAARGSSSCNTQSYPQPGIAFDNSYEPGYQGTSYSLGDSRSQHIYKFQQVGNSLVLSR